MEDVDNFQLISMCLTELNKVTDEELIISKLKHKKEFDLFIERLRKLEIIKENNDVKEILKVIKDKEKKEIKHLKDVKTEILDRFNDSDRSGDENEYKYNDDEDEISVNSYTDISDEDENNNNNTIIDITEEEEEDKPKILKRKKV
jgi:hypothetical protein